MVMFRGIQLRGEFLRQVPQTAGLHMMMMMSMKVVMFVCWKGSLLWCCGVVVVKGVLSYRVSMQHDGKVGFELGDSRRSLVWSPDLACSHWFRQHPRRIQGLSRGPPYIHHGYLT